MRRAMAFNSRFVTDVIRQHLYHIYAIHNTSFPRNPTNKQTLSTSLPSFNMKHLTTQTNPGTLYALREKKKTAAVEIITGS
jgi:hypothetical protein